MFGLDIWKCTTMRPQTWSVCILCSLWSPTLNTLKDSLVSFCSQALSRTQSGHKSRWFELHAGFCVPWHVCMDEIRDRSGGIVIGDSSLNSILMLTLSCRASQATKVQTPRRCQLPLGCYELSGFSLAFLKRSASIWFCLLLYKSTWYIINMYIYIYDIYIYTYILIYYRYILNPISAALHSAMASSIFPDPMNFWLKCFHILEDLQVHTNTGSGWRACMISDRFKWRRNNAAFSFVFFSPRTGRNGAIPATTWK